MKIKIDRPLDNVELEFINSKSEEEIKELMEEMKYDAKNLLELEGIPEQFIKVTSELVGESNEN
jgi:hypothetical protein